MGLMIDADALKGPLELQQASYARIGATEQAKAYADCLWEIAQAPIIGDWISVKDSTPTEMHLNCWVMIKGCPDPMIDRWEGDRGEESTYGFPEDEKTFVKSGWYYNDCNEVTHWMPIRTPEPPEEVSGDA